MLTENTTLPFSSDRFSGTLPRINQATCCVDRVSIRVLGFALALLSLLSSFVCNGAPVNSRISFTFSLVGTKFLNLVFSRSSIPCMHILFPMLIYISLFVLSVTPEWALLAFFGSMHFLVQWLQL